MKRRSIKAISEKIHKVIWVNSGFPVKYKTSHATGKFIKLADPTKIWYFLIFPVANIILISGWEKEQNKPSNNIICINEAVCSGTSFNHKPKIYSVSETIGITNAIINKNPKRLLRKTKACASLNWLPAKDLVICGCTAVKKLSENWPTAAWTWDANPRAAFTTGPK